ncbi:MAG: type II toxin-antitoxin system prevent-host-death family antitoxin [Pseudomonadota bacterium]
MLETIGAYEAKTRLPEILRQVEAGTSFTITNRGRPVADVVPSRNQGRLKTQTAIDRILAATKHPLTDDMLQTFRLAGRT